MAYLLTAAAYPNGEVRLNVTPQYSKPPKPQEDEDWGVSHYESQSETHETGEESSGPLTCPLVETRNFSAGFGEEGKPRAFSLYGKRTMRRCGGAWDVSVAPREIVFLTGTLAGSTEDAMGAIARWSGYIVHRLKAWANKYASNKQDMYCWEWQKRGALHLHYCCWIPDPDKRSQVLSRFQKQWRRLMLKVSELSGVDTFEREDGSTWKDDPRYPRCDAQECVSSAAGYLAKYTSKGSGSVRSRFYPSRWYGCSRPLLELMKSLTVTTRRESLSRFQCDRICEEVFHEMHKSSEYVARWEDSAADRRGLYAHVRDKDERSGLWQVLESKTTEIFTSWRKDISKMKLARDISSIPTLGELGKLLKLLETSGIKLSQPLNGVLQRLLQTGSLHTLLKGLSPTDWRELLSAMSSLSSQKRSRLYVQRVREYAQSRSRDMPHMWSGVDTTQRDGNDTKQETDATGGDLLGSSVVSSRPSMRVQLSLFGTEVGRATEQRW